MLYHVGATHRPALCPLVTVPEKVISTITAPGWSDIHRVALRSAVVCSPGHAIFVLAEAETYEELQSFLRPLTSIGTCDIVLVTDLLHPSESDPRSAQDKDVKIALASPVAEPPPTAALSNERMPFLQPSEFVAYPHGPARPLPLVPAPRHRDWMNDTHDKVAYKCLPLLMSNEAGWFMLNTHRLRVVWNGGPRTRDLTIECLDGEPPYPAGSRIGNGVLSWWVPYVFRTPPGYNLLFRGPANWPKHGAFPIEGLVESDWSSTTFLMNWLITRPNEPVVFEPGDPICMLVPQRRGDLGSFQPRIRDIDTNDFVKQEAARLDGARLMAERHRWHRWWLNDNRFVTGPWTKNYLRGVSKDGRVAPEHQVKMQLNPFVDQRHASPATGRLDTQNNDGDGR